MKDREVSQNLTPEFVHKRGIISQDSCSLSSYRTGAFGEKEKTLEEAERG